MADEQVNPTEQEAQAKLTEQEEQAKKEKRYLPLAPIRRIMKECGVNMITSDGLVEVRNIIESIAFDISRETVVYTNHRKAKIATKEDVRMSVR